MARKTTGKKQRGGEDTMPEGDKKTMERVTDSVRKTQENNNSVSVFVKRSLEEDPDEYTFGII